MFARKRTLYRMFALVAAGLVVLTLFPGAVSAGNNGNGKARTTICHRTDSVTNPWQVITVADPSLTNHSAHGDVIPAPTGAEEDPALCEATPPPVGNGTLNICKLLAPGTPPTYTLFTFDVSGMGPMAFLAPGQCSGPLNLAAGNYTVTEVPAAGFTVSAITIVAGTGTPNVPAGSATVKIVTGETTEVHFTNTTSGL